MINVGEQPFKTDLLTYQFFIDWCTEVMAVAFLKFFISHELESTMWHTKQSGDVTLLNKIQSICSWYSIAVKHFKWVNFVNCTICTESGSSCSKGRQRYPPGPSFFPKVGNAIHQKNPHLLDAELVFLTLIYWIMIYLVDSAIRRLEN